MVAAESPSLATVGVLRLEGNGGRRGEGVEEEGGGVSLVEEVLGFGMGRGEGGASFEAATET